MNTLKLDHLIYAAPDLTTAINDIEQLLGVRAVLGGKHPGVGTQNALLALGPDCYLEIIAPDPEQTHPERPRSFGLDRLDRAKLVTWAVAESNLEERADYARVRGYDPGQIIDAGREQPDGTRLAWRSTKRPEALQGLLPLGDGLLPFLIDWGTAPHPATSSPVGCQFVSLRAEHPQPERIQPLLAALGVELNVTQGQTASLIATVDSPAGWVELR